MGELGEFVKHHTEFESQGVQLLAISVDPPEKGRFVQEKLRVPFPILSDSKREVMELYGTRSPVHHGPGGGSINLILSAEKIGCYLRRLINWQPSDLGCAETERPSGATKGAATRALAFPHLNKRRIFE